jgi:hypothetical protein
MKNILRKFIVLIFSITFSIPSFAADEFSTQALRRNCQSFRPDGNTNDYLAAGMCVGVIMGATDIFRLGCAKNQSWPAVPPGMSLGAMAQLFMNWADRNPDKWNSPAAWGVTVALYEAYGNCH